MTIQIPRRLLTKTLMLAGKLTLSNSPNNFSSKFVSTNQPILIGGCARSGTTLLRLMLNSHKNIAGGRESWLFVSRKIDQELLAKDFDMPLSKINEIFGESQCRASFIDLFFEEYLKRNTGDRWAEKTPKNVHMLGYISKHFPRFKFIHLVRDGRDVVCSLREKRVNLSLKQCVGRWLKDVQSGLKYRDEPWYLEVKYENLVSDTRTVMEQILDFIGEPWDETVLEHYKDDKTIENFSAKQTRPENFEKLQSPVNTTSVSRWKKDLSQKDIDYCNKRMQTLLSKLEYI